MSNQDQAQAATAAVVSQVATDNIVMPGDQPQHALALPTQHAPAAAPKPMAFDLTPTNYEQFMTLANMMAESDFVPKDYRGKPGNCAIAMQWGAEIGLKPLQALQNIAAINGRPSLWGDAMLALVRSSGLLEYIHEEAAPDGTAVCRVKRKGEPLEQVRTFSDADATLAGLAGKSGPWQTNPARMKQMRARAFALRDVFTDVLRGMASAEEQRDIIDMETGRPVNDYHRPAYVSKGAQAAAAAAPASAAQLSAELSNKVKELEDIAEKQGFAAVSAAWKRLSAEVRTDIGRNRRDAILQKGVDSDAKRGQGAEQPATEGAAA